MKKFVFIFAVLYFVSAAGISKAQHGGTSELRLRMTDHSYFTVIFDRKIYDVPSSVFRLSGIHPGLHRLVVRKRINGPYGAYRVIYDGRISIPPHSLVKARINKYNRLITEKPVPVYNYNQYETCRNERGYYSKPPLNMAELENVMFNAVFESDRRIIAEEAISTHKVNAKKIYHILNMFDFESTKLEVAKFAYRYCIDKRNYYIVNKAFSFGSSIRELNNYIGNYNSDYYDDDWNYYNERY